MRFTILLCLLGFTLPGVADNPVPSASSTTNPCYWVSAKVQPGEWWTLHGKCEATIDGEHFQALLYDSEHPSFLRMKVVGTIKNSHVHVSVETENSDYSGDVYDGTLETGKLYKDVFVLVDGYNMLGIKIGPN